MKSRPRQACLCLVVTYIVGLSVVAAPAPAYAQFAYSLKAGSQTDQTASMVAPTGLTTSNLSCPSNIDDTGVPISWTGTTGKDADGNPLAGYYGVWRSVSGGAYALVGSTSGANPATTYTDNTASDTLPPTTFISAQGTHLYGSYNGATTTIGSTYDFGTEPNLVAGAPNGTLAFAANNDGTGSVLEVGALHGGTDYDKVESTITLYGNGAKSNAIAIAPDGGYAYALDSDHDRVDAIPIPVTTSTYAVPSTAAVAVGDVGDPAAMAITPSSSYLLVANYGSGTVTVIGTSPLRVATTITLPGVTKGRTTTAATPSAIAIDPSGSYAYVLDSANDEVDVISLTGTQQWKVTDEIAVAKQTGVTETPAMMDIADNPTDGVEVYVGDSGSDELSVIAEATDKVTTIALGTKSVPDALVAAPDGCYVAVAEEVNKTYEIATVNTTTNTIAGTKTGATSDAISISGDSSTVQESDGAIMAMPTQVSYELQAGATAAPGFLSALSAPVTVSLGRGQVP